MDFFWNKFKAKPAIPTIIKSNFLERPKAQLSMDSDYLYYEYYKSNGIVFRAVNLYVKCALSIKIKNSRANWMTLLMKIMQQLMITGNVFLDRDGHILGQNIKIITNEYDEIINYKINNKYYEKDILHLKLNDYNGFGISPIKVAKKSIESHEEVSKFILGIIQNGGKPSGILSHKDLYEPRKNIQAEIKELYEHMNKLGSVALLEGDYKWQQLGVSPEKLELLSHKIKFEREIAIAFDIPPLVLGVTEGTYSNYKESKDYFVDYAVLPIVNYIVESFNGYFNSSMEIISPSFQ